MTVYCDRCQNIAYIPAEMFSKILCMSCMKECEKNFDMWMRRRVKV